MKNKLKKILQKAGFKEFFVILAIVAYLYFIASTTIKDPIASRMVDILGYFLPIGGVMMTLWFTQNIERQKNRDKKEKNLSMLYWHIYKSVYNIDVFRNVQVKGGYPSKNFYSSYDEEFYLARLAYTDGVLTKDNLCSIIAFYGYLSQLESMRQDCIGEWAFSKNISQFNKTFRFVDKIIHSKDTIPGQEYVNIDEILSKLEPYATAGKSGKDNK